MFRAAWREWKGRNLLPAVDQALNLWKDGYEGRGIMKGKRAIHASVMAAMLGSGTVPLYAQTTPTPATPPPAPVAAPADPAVRQPSLHVRCDGNPPQMSDVESFARILGALTLLALFAPQPEQPDASKRLFGKAGVDACTQLIENPASLEKNKLRLMKLILARAAHQIEAKQYKEALADVGLARAEAKAAGMSGNPYFERSMGLAFDRFESFARLRLGDAEGARATSLSHLEAMPYSFLPVLTAQDFAWANRTMSPAEERARAIRDRMLAAAPAEHIVRLEEMGRFEEAATLREAVVNRANSVSSSGAGPWLLAATATTHALAGHWTLAKDRAAEARAKLDKADEEGKPDPLRAQVIEQLDLLGVVDLMHEGKLDEARRNFAARSDWTVSIGQKWQLADMLRKGAKPEQLFGALAKSGDEQWEDARKRTMATTLQSDTNNRTLFSNILPYATVQDYEKMSKTVWRADKSKMIGDKPLKDSKLYLVTTYSLFGITPFARQDGQVLHTALVAKARGYKGFILLKGTTVDDTALVMFGNAGDPDMPGALYLDADAVIAELRQVIPSPDELEARIKEREKAASKT